jgi:3-deoxy-D-manno-octulosonate 8-phosphate phosphatase (KDO 8-P phosphatase)
MKKSYKEIMHKISTFVFDIDGVLTDGMVTVFTNGELVRVMNTKDGYAMKSAINKGYNICVISGGTNEGVKLRLGELGIKYVYLGIEDKKVLLNTFLTDLNIETGHVLYMGDDLPDYQAMKNVGLPACPKDAAQEIQDISLYISQKKGGCGCVRDVIEQTLKVQDRWKIDY